MQFDARLDPAAQAASERVTYIQRAIIPWIRRLPPISLPIRLPTAESSPSDTREPKSRKWNVGSGLPSRRARTDLYRSEAC